MADVEGGNAESSQGVGLKQLTTKTCATCKLNKPFSKFYRNKSRKDGYDYRCKECATKAKNWCFSIRDYTSDVLDHLLQTDHANGMSMLLDVIFIVIRKELDKSGTPQLQGVVCFIEWKSPAQVKAIIGEAHLTTTRNLAASLKHYKKGVDTTIGIHPRQFQND